MPGMIDKVIEVAESVYREFGELKFHTEQILRNVTVMNRIFDLRDLVYPLVRFTVNPRTMKNDFYVQVSFYIHPLRVKKKKKKVISFLSPPSINR